MEIDELLIKIGVDTSDAAKISQFVTTLSAAANQIAVQANGIADSFTDTTQSAEDGFRRASGEAEKAQTPINKLKLLAIGVAAVISAVAVKVAGFISGAIAGAKNLAQEKGLLFDISKQELQQADEYQEAMKKTGLAMESIKTKIALNLLPQLNSVVSGFNDWLRANKELIAAGLTKVIQWGGKFFQVLINTGRAIGKVIDNTIGWKGAVMALGAAFAFLNRKMLMNPITWIIAGIVGLMLLIDDLMVYLRGGKSLFGDFWGACIGWIKSVMAWWNNLSEEWQTTIKMIGSMWALAFGADQVKKATSGLGLVRKAISFLLSPVKIVTRAVKALFSPFRLLGAMGGGLIRGVGKVAGAFSGAFGTIGKLIFSFGQSLLTSPALFTLNLLKGTAGGLGKAFEASFALMRKAFSKFATLIIGNPVLAALAGIAATAYLIYTYWDDIKKVVSDTLDAIENSELVKNIRENPELSPTGGIRNANWSIPPEALKKGGGTTTVTVEGAKVNQNIVTNDSVKAGNVAASGIKQIQDTTYTRTMNNLGSVLD
ncbi:TPA: hypothetical protein RG737_002284 [Morganella morganii subsp. morganii]|nr:hypothetical protein [Morganella morganii subsp. morganii]